ncbi:MAG: glycosyltransferase [Corynebacterium sp.]|nr:glycosyltransferase [Corynebacterium sp.]
MTSQAVESLQRFLLPKEGEPHDVRMLYLIESERNQQRPSWENRHDIYLPAGTEVSFQTYFNAFPAAYWRRWTQLEEVILKVEVVGAARVDIFKSRLDGNGLAVTGRLLENETAEFPLSLATFEDGGWYWFSITAETDAQVKNTGWFAPVAPGPQVMPDGSEIPAREKRVTVGIPTFNRPADAVAALEALAEDPEVDAIIDAVIMPDQGNKHPADEPGYEAATAHFGERFFEFRQGNLGGSGGYSRIMFEALGGVDGKGAAGAAESPFILYMDDDIVVEPESILRAVQIARYARQPILVGGQMLNLEQPSHLHSMGEVIDPDSFMWTSAPFGHYDHDFARSPLSNVEPNAELSAVDLHRRIDVDYNGWWMCLIPRVVAQEIGQPLPLFIKWDDGEYGLRAGAAGFPTATWPGVAIWHLAWSGKDDAIDWQAYFHLRNRLIVAALYHEDSRKGLLASMLKATTKHLVCMEYSTVAIQNQAMRDFLAGPESLFGILETSLPKVNGIRKEFSDAQVLRSAADLPKASGATGVPLTWTLHGAMAGPKKYMMMAKGLTHMLRKENPQHHEVPQANLAPINARWFSLSLLDGVTVTTADGRGVVYRKRNRRLATDLLRESMELQREVANRFEQLQQDYRSYKNTLTSKEAWAEVFAQYE